MSPNKSAAKFFRVVLAMCLPDTKLEKSGTWATGKMSSARTF
jgi:hypothetical protein